MPASEAAALRAPWRGTDRFRLMPGRDAGVERGAMRFDRREDAAESLAVACPCCDSSVLLRYRVRSFRKGVGRFECPGCDWPQEFGLFGEPVGWTYAPNLRDAARAIGQFGASVRQMASAVREISRTLGGVVVGSEGRKEKKMSREKRRAQAALAQARLAFEVAVFAKDLGGLRAAIAAGAKPTGFVHFSDETAEHALYVALRTGWTQGVGYLLDLAPNGAALEEALFDAGFCGQVEAAGLYAERIGLTGVDAVAGAVLGGHSEAALELLSLGFPCPPAVAFWARSASLAISDELRAALGVNPAEALPDPAPVAEEAGRYWRLREAAGRRAARTPAHYIQEAMARP